MPERRYHIWTFPEGITEDWEKFYDLARSYRKAIYHLLEKESLGIESIYSERDIFPALFLFRHYIELVFKSLILEKNAKFKRNHNLKDLLKKVRKLHPNLKLSKGNEGFIKFLHGLDKYGDAFRFPFDKNMNEFFKKEEKKYDFITLSYIYSSISSIFDEVERYIKYRILNKGKSSQTINKNRKNKKLNLKKLVLFGIIAIIIALIIFQYLDYRNGQMYESCIENNVNSYIKDAAENFTSAQYRIGMSTFAGNLQIKEMLACHFQKGWDTSCAESESYKDLDITKLGEAKESLSGGFHNIIKANLNRETCNKYKKDFKIPIIVLLSLLAFLQIILGYLSVKTKK